MNRNETIKRIKDALKRRSGKSWSVTGGRGTAYGWITIEAVPTRRTERTRPIAGHIDTRPEDYEAYDSGTPGGNTTKADRAELAALLGLESVHQQGESIPAGNDYYQEYIDRAEGRTPAKCGVQYWD